VLKRRPDSLDILFTALDGTWRGGFGESVLRQEGARQSSHTTLLHNIANKDASAIWPDARGEMSEAVLIYNMMLAIWWEGLLDGSAVVYCSSETFSTPLVPERGGR